VADAHAAPAFGAAPLSVTFTGTGVDDDGEIASYSWDFADDGFYDYTDPAEPNPPVQVYDTPGTYHVKFRVEDDLGSWDVDTLIINVSDPDNSPPEATLAVGTGEERGNPPHTVWLDASGSTDEDGTIVEYLWDLNGDGVYDKWSTDAILEHVYVSSGVYDPVVRVEDDQGAQDTATINVTVNFAPVADLDASSTHGDTPFSVEFSAAASTDTDGTIADYEWDLDGDGVFNETGDEADAQGGSTASYTYSDSGIYDATVRVTDNEGLTDTDGLEIKATGWVVVELPYYYNDTLMGISMTLVDGNPAIAFQTWQMFDCMLFYTRSSTSTGTQAEDWLHRIAMARGDEMGHTPKLRIVNGTPACIYAGYIGVAELYLYFTRAATVTGKELESWSMPSELAGSTDADSHDLAEIDGNPAFAVEIDNNTLEYWRSSNTTGTPGSWSHITFTGLATNFDYVELETISGNPAILSVDSAGDAYYMRSTTSTGASLADWTAAVTLPLTGGASDAQQSLTFIEVSGNPAVCYRDVDDDYLYYQRSTTTTGTSAEDWTQTANVSNTTEIRACQMAVVDGKPAIAYLSSTWDLCYAHSSTAAGSSTEDWSTDSVCSAGPGKTVCLIDNDGKPAIAFRDDYYLMYAYYID